MELRFDSNQNLNPQPISYSVHIHDCNICSFRTTTNTVIHVPYYTLYMHTLVAVVLFGFGLGCSSFREAAMALARASSSSQLVGLLVVGKENTTFIP